MIDIEASWKQYLKSEFEKPYFAKLTENVRNEYKNGLCFPPAKLVFNAFNLCPFNKVKVVILGQDPYHGLGQAMGLSFHHRSKTFIKRYTAILVNLYLHLEI